MQSLPTKDFIARVERKRQAIKMSIAELCMSHIGCARSNYYLWLRDSKGIVLDTALKLSAVLDVPIVNNQAVEQLDDINPAKHNALLMRPEATEYILQHLQDGVTKTDICTAFQTNLTTINRLLVKHNIETDGYKRKLK